MGDQGRDPEGSPLNVPATRVVAAWQVVHERFGEHDAPSTLLGVAVLGYPDQLVEVEVVAVRPLLG
jgi:hypothetical protein